MSRLEVVLALGAIAHAALLRAHGLRPATYPFGHNVRHLLPNGRLLVDSYHCSGYNWRTGRLSRESFEAVFAGIRRHLGG
jgi:uracil-DNA glycosylase